VNSYDLRNATHDQAVDVIRSATNPIRFLVQSLATLRGVCILIYWFLGLLRLCSGLPCSV